MHELAQDTDNDTRPNLVLLQDTPVDIVDHLPRAGNVHEKKKPETLKLVRCPECKGLRSVHSRREATAGRCFECKHGKVVKRETFWAWWQERFTMEEIEHMCEAMWG